MLNNLILSAQRIPAQNILRVLFCTSGIGMLVLANLLARKNNGKSKSPIFSRRITNFPPFKRRSNWNRPSRGA